MNTQTDLLNYLNGVPSMDANTAIPSNLNGGGHQLAVSGSGSGKAAAASQMSDWEKHKRRFHNGQEPEPGHCSLKDQMDRNGGESASQQQKSLSLVSGEAAKSYLDSIESDNKKIGQMWKEDVLYKPFSQTDATSENEDVKLDPEMMYKVDSRNRSNRKWYPESGDDLPFGINRDELVWVPDSIGGSRGHWEEKSEEQMIDEFNRYGRLLPGRKPKPFNPINPSGGGRDWMDLHNERLLEEVDKHVNSVTKSFLNYCRSHPGVFKKWKDAAFANGMDLQDYIKHRLGDYKPSFGRVPTKKWDEIVSAKDNTRYDEDFGDFSFENIPFKYLDFAKKIGDDAKSKQNDEDGSKPQSESKGASSNQNSSDPYSKYGWVKATKSDGNNNRGGTPHPEAVNAAQSLFPDTLEFSFEDVKNDDTGKSTGQSMFIRKEDGVGYFGEGDADDILAEIKKTYPDAEIIGDEEGDQIQIFLPNTPMQKRSDGTASPVSLKDKTASIPFKRMR